jgi:hypothetical protein
MVEGEVIQITDQAQIPPEIPTIAPQKELSEYYYKVKRNKEVSFFI